MNRASPKLIFVIGIIGFVLMGLMAKFLFENNPALQELGKFKVAVAETYSGRGLEEISVRAMPGQRGYTLRASFEKLERESAPALAEDLAFFFLEKFQGRKRELVQVSLVNPPRWGGCRGGETVFDKEYLVPDLMKDLQIRAGLGSLPGRTDRASQFRILSARTAGPDAARVEVALEKAAVPPPDEMEAVWRNAERFVWQALAGVPVRWVDLVVRSSAGPGAAIIKEARVERPGISPAHWNQPPRSRSEPPGGTAGAEDR